MSLIFYIIYSILRGIKWSTIYETNVLWITLRVYIKYVYWESGKFVGINIISTVQKDG